MNDFNRKWVCRACEDSPINNEPCIFERNTKKPFRYAVCPFYCDTWICPGEDPGDEKTFVFEGAWYV